MYPHWYYAIPAGGSASVPVFPNQVRGECYTYDTNGAIEGSVTLTYYMVCGPGDSGYCYPTNEETMVSNASGYASALFVTGATYMIRRGGGLGAEFVVPATTFNIDEVLGLDE
jgi:hypothetical protein